MGLAESFLLHHQGPTRFKFCFICALKWNLYFTYSSFDNSNFWLYCAAFFNVCLFMTISREFDSFEVLQLKNLLLSISNFSILHYIKILEWNCFSRELLKCVNFNCVCVFFFALGNAIRVYLGPCQTMELF